MHPTPSVDTLIQVVLNEKLFPRKQSLVYHFKDVFKDIDLKNKHVLDIGGGIGVLSFYCGVMGAAKVVCLEPESDGSQQGMISEFSRLKSRLDDNLPVVQLPLTLQDYLKSHTEKLDIVILHNSINHLSEEACINLRKDKGSYDYYVDMFSTLYANMNKGGKLIISDCSSNNFYNDIGLKSPFINGIEWHKHQSPNTWIALLQKVGFINPSVNWSSPNRLGSVGRVLLKNTVTAYFTSSHFRLVMEK